MPAAPTSPAFSPTSHPWKFFRIGGLDQAAVLTGADLLALKHLDPKLWVALACPVKGLELDEATLSLIDANQDGRIRLPELLAVIDWAAPRLRDLGVLLQDRASLPLAAFDDTTPAGKGVLAAARRILTSLGRAGADHITLSEACDTAGLFAASPFNGDGVITPPAAGDDAATRQLITDILTTQGGTLDRTGFPGIDQARCETFFAQASAWVAWSLAGQTATVLPLGEHTAAAHAALLAVRAKVDDYFARTRLAAYDTRTLALLNRAEQDYATLAARDLTAAAQELAAFPLAAISAAAPLPLLTGVNPAWAAALATLHTAALTPWLGADHTTLTEDEWRRLQTLLAPYAAWLAARPADTVASLGLPRLQTLLASDGRARLAALLQQDLALAPEYAAVGEVEKLLRLARDLRTLLQNFVNFFDFYDPVRLSIFQAGTLFLDHRSTELCIALAAPTPLVAMSKTYIAFCDCKRGAETRRIAACFTQGDSDYLFVGRNGLFYDRRGLDWDATITAIVDNPISIRQSFFSPYKKFVRMIEEQVAKRAAAAEADAQAKLTLAASTAATFDKLAPPPATAPAKPIEVGTVAAIGVAITGAISALTLVLGYLFALKLWQYPLVFVGLIAVISGPSMLIAWLKLRQRTLGPLLEAAGWAINGRIKINMPLGRKLTARARRPLNARLDLTDPYLDQEAARRRRQLLILAALLTLAAGWAAYYVWTTPAWQAWLLRHLDLAPTPVEAPAAPPPKAEAK